MSSSRARVGGHFDLTDHLGARVTPGTYRGRFMLVFFGFTHCGQICPAVLGRNSRALELLGPDADEIQPLYITVDPDRDSPEVLAAYLRDRHPRYTGLTGTTAEIEAAERAYHVFARRADELDDYRVPHTSFTFLMDPGGDYVSHYAETRTADELAGALAREIDRYRGGGVRTATAADGRS
ncbi:SCO family protein [Amycolatopsis endophytica]|uniref:Protein SCO1/2 n=1 Tax=Amycolatopsis endophytica TaxID=860233 RepID=A0A853B7T0_9PSEU|nr:SCO family protein [Amycolatopsis endophytica]NYI90761.1 protein SCO1/2 [Amycolatopsis endophytica]